MNEFGVIAIHDSWSLNGRQNVIIGNNFMELIWLTVFFTIIQKGSINFSQYKNSD